MGKTKTYEPIVVSPDMEAAPFGNLVPTFDYRETGLNIDSEPYFKAPCTFANGGLFAFVGNFHTSDLGAYRAYVTDGMKAVVLKFTDKTIVVSPDEPEEFIAAATSAGKVRK